MTPDIDDAAAIFGVVPAQVIVNLPAGAAVRYKFRQDEFAIVFVKTPTRIASYYIVTDRKGNWCLDERFIIAENCFSPKKSS